LLDFFASSSAGKATLANEGTTNFLETSNAGSAKLTNQAGASLTFFDTSSAETAKITNNSFNDGVNSFGLQFQDAGNASNSTIVNNGELDFFHNSTAGNSTIITNSGGSAFFIDNSSGGNAKLIANSGGKFDFSFGSGQNGDGKIAVGSIAGAGDFWLGGNELTVGGNNASTTVSGSIHDGGNGGGAGASLVKIGKGTLTLSHADNAIPAEP